LWQAASKRFDHHQREFDEVFGHGEARAARNDRSATVRRVVSLWSLSLQESTCVTIAVDVVRRRAQHEAVQCRAGVQALRP
jgi:hypothetical protein